MTLTTTSRATEESVTESSALLRSEKLPAAGTVPTPPMHVPPSSPHLPPPPTHAFPHPRRRPTAPILPDGATRPAPAPPDAQPHRAAPPDAQPHRAAPPDAQPHRAAPPHTVPRANPTWIRMPGAIRAPPPPPSPAWGLPVLTEPHRARHGACHSRPVSDASRSSRTSSEVTHLPRPLSSPGHHTQPLPPPPASVPVLRVVSSLPLCRAHLESHTVACPVLGPGCC